MREEEFLSDAPLGQARPVTGDFLSYARRLCPQPASQALRNWRCGGLSTMSESQMDSKTSRVPLGSYLPLLSLSFPHLISGNNNSCYEQ